MYVVCMYVCKFGRYTTMQIEPVGSSVDTKINNENKGICMYVCVELEITVRHWSILSNHRTVWSAIVFEQ